MASIRKRARSRSRGKHQYEVRYLDPSGKPKSKSLPTYARAEDFANKIETQKLQGDYHDPSLGRELVRSYYHRRWLDLATLRFSPSTLKLLTGHWERYVAPVFGNRKLNSLTSADISSFVVGMAKNTSRYQAETALRLIRSILGDAVQDKILARSVALSVSAPARPPHRPRCLSAPEVGTLAEAHPDRWYAFILVAAYGGLRFGGLAGLAKNRIDFLRRKLIVDQAIIEVCGRNYVRPTKSGKPRSVTLPAFVMDALAEHIRKYPPDQDGLVFCEEDGEPIRRYRFYKQVWWPAIERSGIGHLRFHDLRHTSAALAIAEGAHPKTIQERLGHHSAAFTLDVYGFLFPGLDEALAEQLDAKGRDLSRRHNDEKAIQTEAQIIPLRRRDKN